MNKSPENKLPDKQKRILEFIRTQHALTGVYPSVREIAAYMEFKSTNTVDYHLRRLEESGVLERGGRRARTFSVRGGDRAMSPGGGVLKSRLAPWNVADAPGIPVLGRVAAGEPILAEQHFDGMLNLKSYFHCNEQTFALRVKGDSMINAGIVDGDLVIVRQQPSVENGEIGVAVVNDEATVKRIFDEDHVWRLQPENPKMESIVVKKSETPFWIAGKVIGVIRRI